MTSVELSLSESFHRHKRNLIILCSAIIILRIASPSKLKIPFVGADVDLPSTTAFILLGTALLYMFSQYYIEYQTMLARHSSRIVGTPKQSFDDVIDSHVRDMTGWVANTSTIDINYALQQVSELLSSESLSILTADYSKNFENTLKQQLQLYNSNRQSLPVLQSDKENSLKYGIDQLEKSFNLALMKSEQTKEHTLDKILENFNAISARQEFAIANLADYAKTYKDITSEFRKISSNIGRAQRFGFRWIDGYLVIAFAFVSLIASITGATGFWIKGAAVIVGK